jgi:hypothetical protein
MPVGGGQDVHHATGTSIPLFATVLYAFIGKAKSFFGFALCLHFFDKSLVQLKGYIQHRNGFVWLYHSEKEGPFLTGRAGAKLIVCVAHYTP